MPFSGDSTIEGGLNPEKGEILGEGSTQIQDCQRSGTEPNRSGIGGKGINHGRKQERALIILPF